MKKLFVLPLLVGMFSCTAQTPSVETVFRAVNVIPMDEEKVMDEQDVVIQDGKIKTIGTTGKVKYGKDARIIEAKGKFLIPGLAEMHAHVPPIDDIKPMEEVLSLFLNNGVTTIRGMLGHPRHLELRNRLVSGEIIGPHFYTSGPSFNGTSVKTPETGAQMVNDQKKAGYDFLKLHPGLTKENFAAIAKTAKEAGIPFAGHVSFDVGVWRAIEAGYASIDHLDGFIESLVPGIETMKQEDVGAFAMFIAKNADENKIPSLMKALKEKNIWVVPTQCLAERWFSPDKTPEALAAEPEMIYMKEDELKNWVNNKKGIMANPRYNAEDVRKFVVLRRKLIYECQKNGVGLLLGSDAPQVFDVPGFSVHHELKYMVDAGLSPYQALRTGTVNPARYFNRDDMGMIKPGYVSDLVLLEANPLANIENTKKIAGVMIGNKWLPKDVIAADLKQLQKSKQF
ncbi:MAG TPA: amidohydrolase family protein [Chitinophagaceae bacterium]|nr:amidohydrolase family protein [Chitinophagaceae bacterium]